MVDVVSVPVEELMEKATLEEQEQEEVVEKKEKKKLNLMQLVTTLQNLMKNGKKGADLEKVREALESYDTDLGEYKRYEYFDKSVPYTRNLIASNDTTFNLILLCWTPGFYSPVHDHDGSECFFRMIDGEVTEVSYEWPDGDKSQPLKETCTTTVSAGEVSHVNDSQGLHKVGNMSDKGAVTMHCYIPPYNESKCFCEKTAQYKIGHITFYTKGGCRPNVHDDF